MYGDEDSAVEKQVEFQLVLKWLAYFGVSITNTRIVLKVGLFMFYLSVGFNYDSLPT